MWVIDSDITGNPQGQKHQLNHSEGLLLVLPFIPSWH